MSDEFMRLRAIPGERSHVASPSKHCLIAATVACSSISSVVSPPSVSVKSPGSAFASRLAQLSELISGESYRSIPTSISLLIGFERRTVVMMKQKPLLQADRRRLGVLNLRQRQLAARRHHISPAGVPHKRRYASLHQNASKLLNPLRRRLPVR
jgi:hypothetical protein